MAYRADIEIGVKGAKELLQLQKQLDGTSYKIEQLNKKQATFFGGIAPSVNNFNRQLAQATRALNSVAAGTTQETRAVNNYVTALENANEARQRQNRLIQEEIVKRNGATAALQAYNAAAAAPTRRGAATTMAGGYLRGQPRFGPQPAAGFDPVAAAARTKATVLAKEAIASGKAEKARFDARVQYEREVSQIMGRLQAKINAKARDERLDAVLDEYRLREQKSKDLFEGMLKDNRALLDDFDKRLNKRSERRGAQRNAQGNRGRRFQDIATGAGFPLLFGGGPLQAVAGGVGGAFGSLGGSIAASALIAQVEVFVQNLSKLADSLKSTQGVISGLEAAGYRVSDATKSVIASYEKAGLFTDAYALALAEINRVLGTDGAAKLQAFDQEAKKLNDEFQKVTAALQSEMLPALTGLIRLILGVKSAFDAVAESRLGRAIMGAGTALTDIAVPGFAGARTTFGLLQQAGAPTGEVGVPDSVRLAQEARAETKIRAEQKASDAARDRLYVVQAEVEAVQAGNDLLDDSVVKAREKVIQEQYLAKVRGENVTLKEKELAVAEKELAISQLMLQVDGARKREAERQRREAERAAKQAERLRKQTEQLRLQSMAATMTREQDQKIAAAQLQGNKQEVLRLQILKERLALGIRELQIENEKLPALQQQYKLDIAREQTQGRINKLENDDAAARQKIAEAVQSSIAGMDREIALIDATLEGRRKEVELTQQINALVKSTGANTRDQIDSLERMVRLLDERRQAEESFNIQQQTRFAGAGLSAGFIGGAGRKFEETLIGGGSLKRATELARLTEEMELAQTVAQNLESAVVSIGDAFGTAMTTGVQGLIAGTKSAEEVFTEFLNTIGQALLKAAAEMISTYIAIGIARAFAGMGSNSGASSGFNVNGPLDGMGVANAFAGTGATFAEGGFVDRPTNALIGEGGEPEYVIPESKMRESMARYSQGSRGSSVIPQSGEGGGVTGDDGGATSNQIDVRYTVERINSVDYVTADQFQRGMQTAATQGAKQGEQNTLKRLQMSGSTRRRLGM